MPPAKSQTLASILFWLLALLQPALIQAATGSQTDPPSTAADCDRFRHTGFWDVDIDNYPDLPPECGPPFSADAERDPDHLPIQLVIIFGSYLALTVFVGSSILTIRLQRKKRLQMKPIELQLVEKNVFDPKSPKSPASVLSWMRNPLKKRPAAAGEEADPRSPGIDSIASFDFKVIEHDKANRQAELDRLYAAVAAQGDLRRSDLPPDFDLAQLQQLDRTSPGPALPRSSIASTTRSSRALTEMGLPTRMSVASTLTSRPPDRRLARVAHAEVPRSPVGSVRPGPSRQFEFYDLPEYGVDEMSIVASPNRQYPVSPAGRVQLPNDMYPASPPPRARRMQLPGQPFSPVGASPGSNVATPTASMFSPGLPSAWPAYADDSYRQSSAQDFAALAPLSPHVHRFTERPTSTAVRAANARRNIPAIRINTNLQVQDGDEDERTPLSASFEPTTPTAGEMMGEPESPEQHVQRPATANLHAGRQRKPPTLNLGANRSSSSLNTVTLGLPPRPSTGSLRQVPQAAGGNVENHQSGAQVSKPLPLRAAFDSTPADLQSPGAFKTTILQPRHDAFMRGPRTGRTPMTGIPPTPYSAYMPFTPVTPITPHLVTRRERKDRRKEEKRTILDETDIVKEDDDEETWNER